MDDTNQRHQIPTNSILLKSFVKHQSYQGGRRKNNLVIQTLRVMDRLDVAVVFVVDDVVAVVFVVMVMVVGADDDDVTPAAVPAPVVVVVVVPNKSIGATIKKFRNCNRRDATTHNTIATRQQAVA